MAKTPRSKPAKDGAAKKQRPGLPLSRPCTPQDIIDKARQYGPACIEALVDVMTDGDTAASRVSAANALLDRGFGKVGQPLEVTGKNGDPLQISVSPALDAALDQLKGGRDA